MIKARFCMKSNNMHSVRPELSLALQGYIITSIMTWRREPPSMQVPCHAKAIANATSIQEIKRITGAALAC